MIRVLFAFLALASVALAFDPDAGPSAEIAGRLNDEPAAVITLTSLNSYVITAGSARCCDYADTTDELFVSDYGTDQIYSLVPSTGALNYAIDCPAEIPNVCGVVFWWDTGGHLLINDWNSVHDMYEYTGSWAYACACPVPSEPRGMDIDYDGYIWGQDATTRILYRFDDSGVVQTSFPIAEVPASFSCGVACFPYGSNLGIALTGYAWPDVYFYEFDGATLSYLGSAPVPETCTSSYGLTYSDNSSTFFWVYRTGTPYNVCEFSASIEVALQRETWAGIKAFF